MAYTKLHQELVTSTIWREPHATRILWVTMMALADKNGEVRASIPGLADIARITLPECEAALTAFLSPDAYSRTPDFEGRRIEKIDGGWAMLNHGKYRALCSKEEAKESAAIRQARKRRRDSSRIVTPSHAPSRAVTVTRDIAEAEAEAEAEAVKQNTNALPAPAGPAMHDIKRMTAEAIYNAYPRKQGKQAALRAIAKAVHALWKEDPPRGIECLMASVQSYALATSQWPEADKQYIPHPATWFNRGSYDDDPTAWNRTGQNGKSKAQAQADYDRECDELGFSKADRL